MKIDRKLLWLATCVIETVLPALKLIRFVAMPVMLLTALWPGLSLTIPRLLGLL